jgi:hypothetical protein
MLLLTVSCGRGPWSQSHAPPVYSMRDSPNWTSIQIEQAGYFIHDSPYTVANPTGGV